MTAIFHVGFLKKITNFYGQYGRDGQDATNTLNFVNVGRTLAESPRQGDLTVFKMDAIRHQGFFFKIRNFIRR